MTSSLPALDSVDGKPQPLRSEKQWTMTAGADIHLGYLDVQVEVLTFIYLLYLQCNAMMHDLVWLVHEQHHRNHHSRKLAERDSSHQVSAHHGEGYIRTTHWSRVQQDLTVIFC
jgi:hypothetical protein